MIKAVIFDMFETLITHFRTPLYFGDQMACDAGIPVEDFRRIWDPTSDDRTLGKMTFEEAITSVLKGNGKYSDELLGRIVGRRIETKRDCFRHLDPDIIPMLSALRVKDVSVGLISNCFSEEVPVIKESIIYPFFDAVCFSYEEGVKKPDREIYLRCLDKLGADPDECIYIGDGASGELEAARDVGMPTYQAVWYLDDSLPQVARRKEEFTQLERPLDLLELLDR